MCQRLLAISLFISGTLTAATPCVLGQQADAPGEALPADNQYVQVKDGHLSLDGKRVRYWTWIGHFWCDGENAQFNLKQDDSPEVRQAKIEKQRRIYDAPARRNNARQATRRLLHPGRARYRAGARGETMAHGRF